MHFSCIRSLLFNILVIFELFWSFSDCLFLLPLYSVYISYVYGPKRKSTPAQNLLRFGASSSSNSTPLSLWFHDDDAHKAFSENVSRHGIHSERQFILPDFVDTDLPTIIHSQGWESLCDVTVTCPLVLI